MLWGTRLAAGQRRDWEQATRAGHAAFVAGDAEAARRAYLDALRVAVAVFVAATEETGTEIASILIVSYHNLAEASLRASRVEAAEHLYETAFERIAAAAADARAPVRLRAACADLLPDAARPLLRHLARFGAPVERVAEVERRAGWVPGTVERDPPAREVVIRGRPRLSVIAGGRADAAPVAARRAGPALGRP